MTIYSKELKEIQPKATGYIASQKYIIIARFIF